MLAALAEHGDTRKSDAPLATRCCSVKSDVEATKTVIFTSLPDLFEVSERCLGLRQDVDGAEFGRLPGRRRVEIASDQAGRHELAVAQRQAAPR